jgi:hypothetical protein
MLETASTEEAPKPFNLSGYIQPGFSVLHRGDAVPRDRWRYGAESTRAGLIITGQPVSRWSYTLELVVAGESTDLVSSVDIVDENGDGVPDEVAAQNEPIAGLFVERAFVEVAVTKHIGVVAGRKRVPFTVQEQSPSTALMFPTRSGPNEVFVQGPDFGAGVSFRLPDDLFVAQLGVYNGTGEPLGATDEQGLVYSGRVDFNPLGELPLGEQATGRGPLRVGVGAGVLFYASRHFDTAGFAGARQRDLRASASLRLAVSGFYLQSEVLRRQRTDSLSDRPEITTGAYTQFSWLFSKLVAPLGRVGWAAEDQGFASRSTVWVEGGIAVYPSRDDPDSIRVTALYVEEHRLTESERANGAAVQLQLTW